MSAPATDSSGGGPILFYDGECGLCARAVQWFIARDRRARLRYAPLRGLTYARLDMPDKPTSMETMVLLEDGALHTRSEAAIRLLRIVGGGWSALGTMTRVIPPPLRDAAYRYVAKRRIAWFGTAASCRRPTDAERSRMLE